MISPSSIVTYGQSLASCTSESPSLVPRSICSTKSVSISFSNYFKKEGSPCSNCFFVVMSKDYSLALSPTLGMFRLSSFLCCFCLFLSASSIAFFPLPFEPPVHALSPLPFHSHSFPLHGKQPLYGPT